KVGAGAEATARAGHDNGTDIVVLVGRVERVDQLLLHRAVEGVELVGPVQRDGENLIVDLVLDGLIRHGGVSLYFFVSYLVGWVERSETHHVSAHLVDGFRSTHPTIAGRA